MAGARAGSELARRTAGRNDGTEYGRELAEICAEIEQDREALSGLMDSVGVRPSPVKQGAAWLAERIGRLKPNRRLVSYSPLSRLIEIEGLVIGVSGKLELWRALRAAGGSSGRFQGLDLARMIDRAESQRERLEELHGRAAREALLSD